MVGEGRHKERVVHRDGSHSSTQQPPQGPPKHPPSTHLLLVVGEGGLEAVHQGSQAQQGAAAASDDALLYRRLLGLFGGEVGRVGRVRTQGSPS